MIKIIWSSGTIVVSDTDCLPHIPSPTEVGLSYSHKSFEADEKNPWIRKVAYAKVSLVRVLPGQSCRTFVSYQGLLDRIVQTCKRKKLQYEVQDHREPMPAPKFNLTYGHWHTQFSTLIKLLTKNRSGILRCPTRWGKSSSILNTMRAYPDLQTVLAAPGVDLLGQLVEDLRTGLPDRQIKGLFSGSKDKTQSEDITVCSLDSLDKINPTNVRLLLIDEPHAIATVTRQVKVAEFKNARILGFGATTEGRFDGSDIIIEGLIGPVLVEKTYRDAVKEGAVCPITVYGLRVPFRPFDCGARQMAYKLLLWGSSAFNQLVRQVSERIPADWQTLIFADQGRQIALIQLCVENGVSAMASKMTNKERKDKFTAMKSGEIKRCIATNIYSTGVTFPDLRCVINAAGGGGSITGTQKPGRLAQRRPGKKCGYLIDFLFDPIGMEDEPLPRTSGSEWTCLVKDSQNRFKVYREIGYDVKLVNNVEEMEFV